MKKSLILSFVLGIFFPVIQAQDKYSEYYFKSLPNSPSTATFLRYGDIQNSEYTGTNSPQISLLTAESGSIKIPVILQYISGNGVKVTQEAGSVGLGWDINLPTITQSILGGYSDFDDVAKYLATSSKSVNPFNNYFPHNSQPLPTGFISQPTKDAYSYYKTIDGFLPLNGNFTDLNNSFPFTVDTDTSPDIFTCNLFGQKLEFIVNNYPTGITNHTFTPTFYCLNKKGYKISYNSNTYFTIINPKGTKYFFEKVENVKSSNSISKNYVVTKIIDINNNDINFTYNEYSNIANLTSVGKRLNYADIDATSELALINALDVLRKRPEMSNYQITSYTYNPLIGVTNIIPPSGIREQYFYDSSNRLQRIIDINGKILKENKYNYSPTTFYSSLQSKSFTRNNCGSNSIGRMYNYIVPAGQYTSIIDQPDADQKAINDININGQNAANTNATCTPIYCSLSMNSSVGISGGGSISVYSSTHYKLSFGFSSGSIQQIYLGQQV